jgi:uncharacterized protein YjbI with pentapeptide repeats
MTSVGRKAHLERSGSLQLNLPGADLSGANFQGRDLSHSQFPDAQLRKTNFQGAKLTVSTFLTLTCNMPI